MPDELTLLPLDEFPAALLLTTEAETVGACTGGGGGGDVAGEEEDGAALTTATVDDDVDVGCVGEVGVGVGDLAAARTFGGVALRIGGGGGTAAGLTIADGLESAGADAVAGAAAEGEGATICEDGGGAGKVGFASEVGVGVGEADLGSGGDANGQPGGLSGESDRRLSICTITAYWA